MSGLIEFFCCMLRYCSHNESIMTLTVNTWHGALRNAFVFVSCSLECTLGGLFLLHAAAGLHCTVRVLSCLVSLECTLGGLFLAHAGAGRLVCFGVLTSSLSSLLKHRATSTENPGNQATAASSTTGRAHASSLPKALTQHHSLSNDTQHGATAAAPRRPLRQPDGNGPGPGGRVGAERQATRLLPRGSSGMG
jgi:hypothetical protein